MRRKYTTLFIRYLFTERQAIPLKTTLKTMIVKKDDYQPSLAVTEQQVYHRENHSEDQYLHKKEGEETTIRRKGSSLVLLDYQDHYQDHCYHCLCRGNSAFFIRVMMLSILLCLLTLFPIACYSAGGSMRHVEKRILDQIIGEGYDSRIRPSGANSSKETGQLPHSFIVS